ncbi:hypothetical protein QJ054_33845 [Streptomyces sp. AN-3]|uniref:hypothetical protein n=1 Tax=Streptomyces sp. AN-3 TaxID=3044177 RepID=UPI00249B165C|nr:hypothetical protein [Streptomyces sp. AN-3]MDI3102021.1 hypothetical protein [Streptomyces sp. AN-3]MDV6291251.1 hypothetical protein [Streptomyces sp. UP1A-1]
MTEEALVEWLISLAPVLSPLFGMMGVLGGAWMVYRQNKRKLDQDADTAQSTTFVTSVQTVTNGFTQLLEQQRETNAKTLERVTTLENRVERLEEEQRQWRRWKAAAVEYIHQLRALVAKLYERPVPPAPPEIAEDLDDAVP